MAQSGGGAQVPEFLSTHPTDSKRIANIEKILPDVMQYYKGSGVQNNTSAPIKTKADVPVKTEKARTSEEWSF